MQKLKYVQFHKKIHKQFRIYRHKQGRLSTKSSKYENSENFDNIKLKGV
jgi:hypothetical protein